MCARRRKSVVNLKLNIKTHLKRKTGIDSDSCPPLCTKIVYQSKTKKNTKDWSKPLCECVGEETKFSKHSITPTQSKRDLTREDLIQAPRALWPIKHLYNSCFWHHFRENWDLPKLNIHYLVLLQPIFLPVHWVSVWRYAGWLHNSTASYPRHLFSSAGGELSLERGLGLVYLECIWRCEELQVHGLIFLKHSGIRLSRGKFTLPDIFSLPVFSRRTFVRHLTHLTKVLILIRRKC